MPVVQLKVKGLDLKSFGSFESDYVAQSYYSGTNASNRWCHVRVKEGRLIAGVFVNSPMAANFAIKASKKLEQNFSAQEIRDMIYMDEL